MKGLRIASIAIPALALIGIGAHAAAVASAGPDASPPPGAIPALLRTIVTVHAQSGYCKDIAEKLGRGIELLSDSNLAIGDVERTLRSARFENGIDANATLDSLAFEDDDLRRQSSAGRAEMSQLLATIEAGPKPEEPPALLKFEAALDGAFARQKRLATEIGAIRSALAQNHAVDQETAARQQSTVTSLTSGGITDMTVPIPPDDLARIAAADVRRADAAIVRDEDVASDVFDAALAGCR